jgi:hypothetical protein
MAKRLTNRQRLAFKIETLTDSEVNEVLEYISIMETMRRPQSAPIDDDLVNFLADATENRRARQVLEWDRVRRRADVQADMAHLAMSATGKN